MKDYQLKYIENLKRIFACKEVFSKPKDEFEVWYRNSLKARDDILSLKEENDTILKEELFPILDDIYGASEEELADLEEFADTLMDWKTKNRAVLYE